MSSNDSYPPSGQAGPDGEAVGLTSWQPAQPDPYGSPAPGPQWAAPAQPWSAAAPVPAPAPPTPDHQVPNPYGAPGYGAPSYGAPAGPVYPAPPIGAPMYAPTPVVDPKNGMAVASFVVSLVMLAAGLFTGFYIGSLVVVWLGIAGLRKANALDAAGYGPRGRVLAWIGIAIGVVNLAIVWGLRIAAI